MVADLVSESERVVHSARVQHSGLRGAFSISEWCRYRGICPATFYNRRRHGEMPRTVKIGRRTIITAEADEEWRLRMEQRAAIPPMSKAG